MSARTGGRRPHHLRALQIGLVVEEQAEMLGLRVETLVDLSDGWWDEEAMR